MSVAVTIIAADRTIADVGFRVSPMRDTLEIAAFNIGPYAIARG